MNLPRPDNDLNERLDYYIQRAVTNNNSELYAFGYFWCPNMYEEKYLDRYFGFFPAIGIHDIHMNQENSHEYKETMVYGKREVL